MRKYEYTWKWISETSIGQGLRTLNDLGGDGWQVVAMFDRGHGEFSVYLMREVRDQ